MITLKHAQQNGPVGWEVNWGTCACVLPKYESMQIEIYCAIICRVLGQVSQREIFFRAVKLIIGIYISNASYCQGRESVIQCHSHSALVWIHALDPSLRKKGSVLKNRSSWNSTSALCLKVANNLRVERGSTFHSPCVFGDHECKHRDIQSLRRSFGYCSRIDVCLEHLEIKERLE